MRNRWIWTRIDYHPCISSEPTNQVCWALLLWQLCNSRPQRYANFNFVILSVIIAPRNVLTAHISKTHLFTINLIYVNSSWVYVQKTSEGKREAPFPLRGSGSPAPQHILKIYWAEVPLFIEVCVFRMRFSLNKIFCWWCMS